MTKRILIVGSSKLPIPALKGGAVPNLVENIIKVNEDKGKLSLTCISCYDRAAEKEAKKYKNTTFVWVRIPNWIKGMDRGVYIVAKKILHLSRLLSLTYFFHISWFVFFTARHLKSNEYDCVVFENSLPALHALRLFGNKKKYYNKYCLHMHAVPRHYYLSKGLVEKSRIIICVSQYVKKEIMKVTKIDGGKFKVLYNCIDTSLFRPLKKKNIIVAKKKYKIPLDKRIILFAGRLCEDKGVRQVIEAQKVLSDEYALLIVGANFYKTSIKSKFEEKLKKETEDLKDQIFFTGYIDYDDMPIIYNCADVIVLPSMWEEPAGMTIIEGLACGKPVITTFSGGIPEYVGKNNCVLLKRDEKICQRIAEEIKKICTDIRYADEMVSRACCEIKKFNLDNYYDFFMDILREVG